MCLEKETEIASEAKMIIPAHQRQVATKLNIKEAMKKLGIPRRRLIFQ